MFSSVGVCRRITLSVSLILICLLGPLCVPVWGQKSSGDVVGTVTDPSGAAVAGVDITVTNANTGEVRKVTTDELGNYRFPFVPPGMFSVRAEKSGFRGVTVESGSTAVKMKIGNRPIVRGGGFEKLGGGN